MRLARSAIDWGFRIRRGPVQTSTSISLILAAFASTRIRPRSVSGGGTSIMRADRVARDGARIMGETGC